MCLAERLPAIQYKHTKIASSSSIGISDITTSSEEGKKLTFYKYYKSLEISMPDWIRQSGLELELASNLPVEYQLSICIDTASRHFTDVFFQNNIGSLALHRMAIIASILKHNGKLSGVPHPDHPRFYLDYLDTIITCIEANVALKSDILSKLYLVFKDPQVKRASDNEKLLRIKNYMKWLRNGGLFSNEVWTSLQSFLSEKILPNASTTGVTHMDAIIANHHPDNDKVIRFLRKIKFSYSEPDKDTTSENITHLLQEIFRLGSDGSEVLYKVFFYHFMEWLSQEQPSHITNHEIKQKFDEWKSRFITFQQWIGISDAYQKSLVTNICGQKFSRADSIEKFQEFESSTQRGLVLFGERGAGKSTVIDERQLEIPSTTIRISLMG